MSMGLSPGGFCLALAQAFATNKRATAQGAMMPVEGLIFDLDGTLVDTALSLIDRPPLNMDQFRGFVGHGSRALIQKGVAATGPAVDEATLVRLNVAFLDYYGENIAHSSVMFDGLQVVLDKARAAGCKLGVCTNKVEQLSLKLLTELGVMPLFDAVVGGDTLAVMKPDPAPYFETARRMGVDPQRTMMFGDSETDIRTAQAAGVPVIAVTFGYTPEHVSTFNPSHVIEHYDEAWPIVARYL
jgi:phosphoglycolate phosphatase